LVSSLRRSLKGRGLDALNALIAQIFSANEQGAFYIPRPVVNGTQALFQDAAGTTPVTADGDPVGKMLDQSGNNNHATQTVSGSRAVYRTDGVLHWLEFDGVDDILELDGAFIYNTDFHVALAVLTSGSNILIGGVTSDRNKNLHLRYKDGATTFDYFRNALTVQASNFRADGKGVVLGRTTAAGRELYLDGVLIGQDSDTSKPQTPVDTLWLIGGMRNERFGGNFYGMTASNAQISNSEVADVSNYLIKKTDASL